MDPGSEHQGADSMTSELKLESIVLVNPSSKHHRAGKAAMVIWLGEKNSRGGIRNYAGIMFEDELTSVFPVEELTLIHP